MAFSRKLLGAGSATLCSMLVLGVAGDAHATTSAEGRVEDRLPDRNNAQKTPGDFISEKNQQEQSATSAPFALRSLQVTGSTVFTQEELSTLSSAFVGKSLSQSELGELTALLTKAYRDRGYFLSRVIIPPQSTSDGTLKLQAIEGYIVSATGSGVSDEDIASIFSALLSERPARLKTFERATLLLADRPGYRVKNPRLTQSPGNPAVFTLAVEASVNPVSLDFFADNRGDGRNGEDQTFAGVSWNSLLTSGDRLSASIFTSPGNLQETFYSEVSYAAHWFGGDLRTEWGASMSQSQDPDYTTPTLGNFEAHRSWFSASTPLLRSRQTSLWLNLMLDARDTRNDDGYSPTRDENLRVLRGSFSYSDVGQKSSANVTLQVSRGIDGLGASHNGDPDLSRSDSRPQFTRVKLTTSYFARLVDKWSINVSATGQYADGALPSGEEFNFGGARYGRGYDYNVIGGDNGWAASAELRYTLDASFMAMDQLQFFVFGDAGRSMDLLSGTPGYEQLTATSAGGGLRLFITPDLVATVEAALPLAYSDTINTIDNTRIFVSLSWWK